MVQQQQQHQSGSGPGQQPPSYAQSQLSSQSHTGGGPMAPSNPPSGGAPPTEGQTCLGCNATSTPEWRRGPMGMCCVVIFSFLFCSFEYILWVCELVLSVGSFRKRGFFVSFLGAHVSERRDNSSFFEKSDKWGFVCLAPSQIMRAVCSWLFFSLWFRLFGFIPSARPFDSQVFIGPRTLCNACGLVYAKLVSPLLSSLLVLINTKPLMSHKTNFL
ncbi:hypothetical protein F5880DRAFT_191909 [Lentinula raphanica]|nr:hypothetical protein F5880DRAFT_191909 [Lentinula raphanica]